MPHKNRVRIYRQNQTMETCLCCCILMILDYYYRLPGGRSILPVRWKISYMGSLAISLKMKLWITDF